MTREETDELADRLAARAQRGDAAAFDDLCRLLRDDVWRYCHALLDDREKAFDAAQDAFVRLVRALDGWRGDAPVRVFTMVLARRAVADLIRSEQRRRRHTEAVEQAPTTTPAHTGTVEVAELIANLDDGQHQAFVLTQVMGMTYEEAAEIADVAVGTIRSRVSRARQALTTALDQADRS